jgi:hypothetical protein
MKKINLILIISIIPMFGMAEPSGPLSQLIVGWEGEMIFLALLLGIIAIVKQFMIARKISRKLSKNDKILNSLRNDIDRIEKKQQAPNNIKSIEDRLKQLEDKATNPEEPSREIVWDRPSIKKAEPVIEQVSPNQQPVPETLKPAHELVYAKFANLDEGFGPDIITTAQNGEQVYEIEITGDNAVFRIANDIDAQRYALAEAAYTFNKACELVNQPFKGCRIVLHREGTLVKMSGNWIIQQKAKIEFK